MIQVLDQKTINQIAAGEVIERPMAVVKELVENAIDAGATAITVEIKEGGISFVRITDNGTGIAQEEIKTAFLRHATSKIKTMEDLLTVHSLGFRGEALSSIAAVAQVEVITRTSNSITGVRYEIAGGVEQAFESIGCPEGTTFIVRNLFYNTPARRKFLKSKTTEGNYIQDLIVRYSLARPDIRFHFISEGTSKLQTSGDGKLQNNIYCNYGAEITKALIPIHVEEKGMTLTGFIGKPELSRGNRTFMNYFVNGRYIKSPIITNAIEHGYKEYMMNHRYPYTALLLTIDSSNIDVNVHPTKMEVRFTNQEDVYDLFYHTIQSALQKATLIPEVTLAPEKKTSEKKFTPVIEKKAPEPFEQKRQEKEQQVAEMLNWKAPKMPVAEEEPVIFEQSNLLKEELIVEEKPRFRMIGQVFDTYWLIEYEKELLIIDQHAAHEKVLYEKLMKRLKNKEPLVQNLAAPMVVTLSAREIEILNQYADSFVAIGFQWEEFGDTDYLITGVPADFLNLPYKELFLSMLDEFMEEKGPLKPELVLDHCATMSCKAAVKGNHLMSFAEAKTLIEEMLQMEHPYHCPHGRPTTISMTKQEFEKKFKRIL